MKQFVPVYHAEAWDSATSQYVWVGMGTPSEIVKRRLRAAGPILYCSEDLIPDGWLDRRWGSLRPCQLDTFFVVALGIVPILLIGTAKLI